jgi:hypothetical protein
MFRRSGGSGHRTDLIGLLQSGAVLVEALGHLLFIRRDLVEVADVGDEVAAQTDADAIDFDAIAGTATVRGRGDAVVPPAPAAGELPGRAMAAPGTSRASSPRARSHGTRGWHVPPRSRSPICAVPCIDPGEERL